VPAPPQAIDLESRLDANEYRPNMTLEDDTAALGLMAPDFMADPHRLAAEYRPRSAAVYDGDMQAWTVLRHADVSTMLRDPHFKKDPAVAVDGPYTQALLAGARSMLFMDDPDHRRLRGLVNQAFSRRATESNRPRVQAIVDTLLDAMAEADGPVDLITALATPFPITVIAEILGIDPADQADFKRWSDDGALSFNPMLPPDVAERVATSTADLHAYLAGAIEDRRAAPGDDLISALVAVQDADGTQLSDEEAVSSISLLLLAGNITTTDLIGNGVLALLQHPEQLAALLVDPSLITNAVEEMLRFDPPVLATDRIPTADIEVGGCPIAKGEWMWPALASANRDPSVHPDPDRFDIRRTDIHHVSFGGGAHLCLGAPLARMEAQIAIGSLLARFPRIRLADPAAPPQYKAVPGFRGLATLEVLLT
jgi:cytochrome P450